MPKKFGHTVCTLATIMMSFSFVGCRSTTTRLASVPGLGWLERSDEGWAQYEPAPDLPSATSEPTGLASGANNIAASTTPKSKPFGNPFDKPAATSSDLANNTKPRFDASRYIPKGMGTATAESGTRNAASNYGDYAAAYGKYGPPKSLNKSAAADTSVAGAKVAPQKGLYSGTGPEKSSVAQSQIPGTQLPGKFSAPPSASGTKTDSTYDFAPRFDNSATGNEPDNSVASSNSPLKTTQPDAKPQSEPYVPPGFVRSPTPSKFAERFGGFTTQVADASRSSVNNLAKAAGDQLAAGKEAIRSSAQQTYNRFTNPGVSPGASQTEPGLATNVQNSLVGGADRLAGQAKSTTQNTNAAASRFGVQDSVVQNERTAAELANQARTGFEQNAATGLGKATSRYGDFASSAASQMQAGASNFGKAVGNSPAVAAAKETAQAIADNATSTAPPAREPIHGVASTAGLGTRNVMQSVSSSVQPAYPSTSTPNPFVIPGGAVFEGNSQPAATETKTPPATSGSPTIRSSAPFRPGSTTTFQGAQTAQKPLIEMASHSTSSRRVADDRLVLAVGDRYQFPKVLR